MKLAIGMGNAGGERSACNPATPDTFAVAPASFPSRSRVWSFTWSRVRSVDRSAARSLFGSLFDEACAPACGFLVGRLTFAAAARGPLPFATCFLPWVRPPGLAAAAAADALLEATAAALLRFRELLTIPIRDHATVSPPPMSTYVPR